MNDQRGELLIFFSSLISDNDNKFQNHHYGRSGGSKHTTVLEGTSIFFCVINSYHLLSEIHEERDSLPDDENSLENQENGEGQQRKTGIAGGESPKMEPADKKLEDPLDYEDDMPRTYVISDNRDIS